MIQGVIIRGTTPELEFDFPYSTETVSNVRVIYGQHGRQLFIKLSKDCSFSENKIKTRLTQEETYLMRPNQIVEVEIRVKLRDNQIVRCGEVSRYQVSDSMDTEIME
jgi:hypothetical protein